MSNDTKISVTGNLAESPELKTSQRGNKWTEAIVLHTDREQNQATGEWYDTATTRYQVKVFGQRAEQLVAATTPNGNITIRVEGTLKIKDVRTKDGSTLRIHEILATEVTPTFGRDLVLTRQVKSAQDTTPDQQDAWAQG